MRQQVSKELFSYWKRLKGARAAPDRADIDPAAIRGSLADTFMIEVDTEATFPMRISGTRLNALWLTDQKTRSFLDLWREEDRRSMRAALFTVVDGVTPIVAGARAYPVGLPPLEMELLLLPLRHFGKTHSRVLGSLSPSYQPDWVGHRSAGPLNLLSLRILQAEATPAREPAPSFDSFGERTAAVAARPRLVVYEGGKRL